MKEFQRDEHRIIAALLRSMNHAQLQACQCFFGGGTAIVLTHGEYRRSLDIDFLCSDREGYRALRSLVGTSDVMRLFPPGVRLVRDAVADTYGVRALLDYEGLLLKLEFIREGRVEVSGSRDPDLGVPMLCLSDMVTEKLLANADRCYDRAVAYRDAIDLGHLIRQHGGFPSGAVEKAETAYGDDIARKMTGVLRHLQQAPEVEHAIAVLAMDQSATFDALAALRQEVRKLWPSCDL